MRVLGRADEGTCTLRPFRCETADGQQFWVKGRGAGQLALCREWMAGRIAQLLDLPIPPIAQVEIPSGLIRFDHELARDLGAGVAFGSRHVANAMEFAVSRITDVPEVLRWRLLFFDWWVMNEDRYLGPSGGNVNLLWTEADARLHVID